MARTVRTHPPGAFGKPDACWKLCASLSFTTNLQLYEYPDTVLDYSYSTRLLVQYHTVVFSDANYTGSWRDATHSFAERQRCNEQGTDPAGVGLTAKVRTRGE